MQSEKAATGRRVLHPAQDYCRLCLLQRSTLSNGLEHMDGSCLSPVDSLSPVLWRGDLPEDSMGHPDHCVPQRRHIHLGPSHYPIPEICSPPCYSWREVRACRLDWPLDPRLAPCACVWDRHRECGCARQWYHHDMPLHHNHIAQLPPVTVKGQRHYREARYVSEEHYWDYVREGYHRDSHSQGPDWDYIDASEYDGHWERRHVRFQGHDDRNRCNSPVRSAQTSPAKTNCNGSPAFFPTEVPQNQFRSSRISGPSLPGIRAQGGEIKLGQAGKPECSGGQDSRKDHRKSQGTVREQIKQVVTELEDVLGGLKQVQSEMKEVRRELLGVIFHCCAQKWQI